MLGDIDEGDAKMNSLTHRLHHENLNRTEGNFCRAARADNASNRTSLADRQTIALHGSRIGTHRPRECENELVHSSSSSRDGPNDDTKKQSTDSTDCQIQQSSSENTVTRITSFSEPDQPGGISNYQLWFTS
uniref:Uncharacterized protein n=1 Tax=Vespula pensylvanica TaxID=30213 RepID=A0A834UCP0_VESPE|nr:hypothetical protein H0235_004205 [Vespula pensylvanica]